MNNMRWRALLWLLLALGLAVAGGIRFSKGLPLQTNLLALLPATERNPLAEEAVDRLAHLLGNRVIFLVGGAPFDETGPGARRFAAALRESGAFRQVIAEIPPFDARLPVRFYHPYRFNLFGDADRKAFAAGTFDLDERLRRKLYAPFRFGPAMPLADDPFGLADAWLAELPLKNLFLEPEGGLLVARRGGKTWAFVAADLPGSAYDNTVQREVMDAVAGAEARLRTAPALEVLRAGAVFHAEAARRSAEREFDFIGLGSLSGILALLYLVFRSLRPLALGLLSVSFGIGVAVLATVSVHGELHLITLVFGASLIGEAIDYSIQYFAARLGAGSAWEPMAGLRRITPGLFIALATSAMSYLTLALAPFPALSQIALFALSGLAAACLTVFLLLPWLLVKPGHRDPETAVALPRRILAAWKARVGWRGSLALSVALLALALPGVLRLTGNDDVRLLVTRPPALQAQEERIRELAGVANGSQFFLVEGDNPQTTLRREEALATVLAKLADEGALAGFTAISRFVPSMERQSQNRALWRQSVFADTGALGRMLSEAGLRDEVGERLSGDFLDSENRFADISDWLESPLSAPFRHLWLGWTEKGAASIVLPQDVRGASGVARLEAATAGLPGTSFVDKAGSVSRLFREYRQWGACWLLGAVALVYGVLCLRYGALTAVSVLTPTLLAIALAAGLFGYLDLPFTLFNLMGLMLVLGVGVNYAIFLKEGGDNSAATLAGVLLSAGTTLLSFGLLALSSMPALAGFGLTLLTGVGAAALLTPMILSFPQTATRSLRENTNGARRKH
jgi:predicted exporter